MIWDILGSIDGDTCGERKGERAECVWMGMGLRDTAWTDNFVRITAVYEYVRRDIRCLSNSDVAPSIGSPTPQYPMFPDY